MPFPPAYNPREVEDAIEKRWEKSGYFNPDLLVKSKSALSLSKGPPRKRTRPFSVVMPPPNATGILHLGHATMLAIEDIMIRYHRMKGDDTVWIPGTDHAAIATQNVVEKELWKAEHKTRHDLGREAFLKRVKAFVEKSKDTIRKQIRKMGASCDWSREAYTLDADRSRAVNAMFEMMYDDGLIYRGKRIVNWCPRCKSTLADDEVEYKEEKTPFYYFKYGPVIIGTARPETKFADKTIVVHPKDKRYTKLVGKEFDVEWIEGKVFANVIADPVIDPEFGSGAMTITPGHSFEDFDIAKQHGLPILDIIDENGNFTDVAGPFAGKNARSSRQAIVDILTSKGLVDRIDENYVHNLSICYRCDTPIEPLTKRQWFVDVNKKFRPRYSLSGAPTMVGAKSKGSPSTSSGHNDNDLLSLKDLAIAAVKSGQIKIIPDRFEAVYYHWMNNLRDWCISRQIWFGHRIPVWYCIPCHDDPKKFEAGQYWTVGGKPKQCPRCGSTKMHQDYDTFDTWFSSSAWTFTTMGWPNDGIKNKELGIKGRTPSDLNRFHPTSVLETGYDILFFWVARMILMTEYALKTVPFKTVYLHGLVRDAQGRKMSKSIGNVIDPLVVSEKFGTDAVRLSLVVGTTPGNDVKLSEQKIEGYRNFVNKLWNIARFVSTSPTNYPPRADPPLAGESHTNIRIRPKITNYQLLITNASLADRWILSRLQYVIKEVTDHIEGFRFSQAAETLRHFTWDDFADWYIEIAKYQVLSIKYEVSTVAVLEHVLSTLLKLWHPFMPFVTEEIWRQLHGTSRPGSKNKNIVPEQRRGATVNNNLLLIADWPKPNKSSLNPKAEKTFASLQAIVREIRSARADFSIPPSATIEMHLKAPKPVLDQMSVIEHLTKTKLTKITNYQLLITQKLLTLHPNIPNTALALDLHDLISPEKETARLKKTIAEIECRLNTLHSQLKNKEFLKNAPRDIISTKKTDAISQETRLKKLREQLKSLA